MPRLPRLARRRTVHSPFASDALTVRLWNAAPVDGDRVRIVYALFRNRRLVVRGCIVSPWGADARDACTLGAVLVHAAERPECAHLAGQIGDWRDVDTYPY